MRDRLPQDGNNSLSEPVTPEPPLGRLLKNESIWLVSSGPGTGIGPSGVAGIDTLFEAFGLVEVIKRTLHIKMTTIGALGDGTDMG